ncbi:A24 family peptidase [Actinosynnema sp. NPDC047251]|nr:A24 family peptidase [Saccharothrix espanaensis]
MVIPLSGLVAGTLGASLLRAIPRGANVRWLWCALPTAALWAITASVPAPDGWLPVPLLLSWLLVLVAATDLRHGRLPNALTLPAYPAVAVVLWFAGAHLERSIIGCLVFFGVHFAVHRWRPAALGGGDVKLAGALGAVLGAVSWLALPVAAALASAITLVGVLRRPRDALPHGPGLAAATWLTSMSGPW